MLLRHGSAPAASLQFSSIQLRSSRSLGLVSYHATRGGCEVKVMLALMAGGSSSGLRVEFLTCVESYEYIFALCCAIYKWEVMPWPAEVILCILKREESTQP